MPDKTAVVNRLLRENQIFYRVESDNRKYIPSSFDMASHQYIIRTSNVYRSTASSSNHSSSSNVINENDDTFGILIEG